MFAFRNYNMQMLSSAIRALGKDYFEDDEKKRQIRSILREVPEEEFAMDITIPPVWVGDIIRDYWNA